VFQRQCEQHNTYLSLVLTGLSQPLTQAGWLDIHQALNLYLKHGGWAAENGQRKIQGEFEQVA
jgi:hypothetical protein